MSVVVDRPRMEVVILQKVAGHLENYVAAGDNQEAEMATVLGIEVVGRIENTGHLGLRLWAAGKLLLVVCKALVRKIHAAHLVNH